MIKNKINSLLNEDWKSRQKTDDDFTKLNFERRTPIVHVLADIVKNIKSNKELWNKLDSKKLATFLFRAMDSYRQLVKEGNLKDKEMQKIVTLNWKLPKENLEYWDSLTDKQKATMTKWAAEHS
jgi:hypothetical protein